MEKIELWSIDGNEQRLDGGSMFGNAPRAVWQKWIAPDDRDRIPLACRALLMKIGEQRILCETGIGAFFEPKMADRFGVQNADRHMLIENLDKIGISHSDIDWVILSHLHFDHAGGLLPTYQEIQNGNDALLFDRAKYVVGYRAWERCLNPHFRDRASFIPGLADKLQSSGRLVIVEGQTIDELFPQQIRFFESDGHTPGQLHTEITGENAKVIYCGDLIPGIPWVHLPITMGYDRYPEKLIDEKRELYERLSSERDILFFTHDPGHVASQFARDEKGRVSAVHPQEKLESYHL